MVFVVLCLCGVVMVFVVLCVAGCCGNCRSVGAGDVVVFVVLCVAGCCGNCSSVGAGDVVPAADHRGPPAESGGGAGSLGGGGGEAGVPGRQPHGQHGRPGPEVSRDQDVDRVRTLDQGCRQGQDIRPRM